MRPRLYAFCEILYRIDRSSTPGARENRSTCNSHVYGDNFFLLLPLTRYTPYENAWNWQRFYFRLLIFYTKLGYTIMVLPYSVRRVGLGAVGDTGVGLPHATQPIPGDFSDTDHIVYGSRVSVFHGFLYHRRVFFSNATQMSRRNQIKNNT